MTTTVARFGGAVGAGADEAGAEDDAGTELLAGRPDAESLIDGTEALTGGDDVGELGAELDEDGTVDVATLGRPAVEFEQAARASATSGTATPDRARRALWGRRPMGKGLLVVSTGDASVTGVTHGNCRTIRPSVGGSRIERGLYGT